MSTRAIDRSGGTILHTSRVNPSICKPEQVPSALEPQKGTPDDFEAYRHFTLEVARPVAEAHAEHGTAVSDEEQAAMGRISAALGSAATS